MTPRDGQRQHRRSPKASAQGRIGPHQAVDEGGWGDVHAPLPRELAGPLDLLGQRRTALLPICASLHTHPMREAECGLVKRATHPNLFP